MDVKNFLRKQVRLILEKEGDKTSTSPSKSRSKAKITRGRVGRGGIGSSVKEAEALANQKPELLMKKLGVIAPGGSTDEEKVLSVVRQSITNADVMKKAYSGASLQELESGQKYVEIFPREISNRNAVLYMTHVLVGAQNAGFLTGLTKEVVVGLANIDSGQIAAIQFKDNA